MDFPSPALYYCTLQSWIPYRSSGKIGLITMLLVLTQPLGIWRLTSSAVTRYYDFCPDGFDVYWFETEYCEWFYFHGDVLWVDLGILVICYVEEWSYGWEGSGIWRLKSGEKMYLAWACIVYLIAYINKDRKHLGCSGMLHVREENFRPWNLGSGIDLNTQFEIDGQWLCILYTDFCLLQAFLDNSPFLISKSLTSN